TGTVGRLDGSSSMSAIKGFMNSMPWSIKIFPYQFRSVENSDRMVGNLRTFCHYRVLAW
ncbi:hypothetical protein SCLCIDRAFT_1208007, partial [Scleroderma citrinum Foug A]